MIGVGRGEGTGILTLAPVEEGEGGEWVLGPIETRDRLRADGLRIQRLGLGKAGGMVDIGPIIPAGPIASFLLVIVSAELR